MENIKSYWVPVSEWREVTIPSPEKVNCSHAAITHGVTDVDEPHSKQQFCVDCGHVLTWLEREVNY